jgi:hypothetical protein
MEAVFDVAEKLLKLGVVNAVLLSSLHGPSEQSSVVSFQYSVKVFLQRFEFTDN